MTENKQIVIARPIKDFPDYYITNIGTVYSRKTYKNHNGRIKRLAIVQRKTGYVNIGLNRDNVQYVLPLHRLVAQTFVPNPANKPQVNHKNGIKSDNRAENLEWLTASENIRHSWDALGQKRTPYNSKRKWVVRLKNNIVIDKFWGTREAERHTGISQARISECCRGKATHAGGFHWKYI